MPHETALRKPRLTLFDLLVGDPSPRQLTPGIFAEGVHTEEEVRSSININQVAVASD